jgi:TolA-binding protein
MPDVVIVAIISLLGTMFGSIAGVMRANNLVTYRLSELEKKMDKYNNIIERVSLLEQDSTTQWKRLDELRETLDDLRKEMNL